MYLTGPAHVLFLFFSGFLAHDSHGRAVREQPVRQRFCRRARSRHLSLSGQTKNQPPFNQRYDVTLANTYFYVYVQIYPFCAVYTIMAAREAYLHDLLGESNERMKDGKKLFTASHLYLGNLRGR